MHCTCFVLWLIERQILYLLSFRAGSSVAIDRVLFCFGLWSIERGIKYLKRGSCGLWLLNPFTGNRTEAKKLSAGISTSLG